MTTLTDWGQESLSTFMNLAATRLHQTHAGLRESWAKLVEVDYVFSRISENLDESPHYHQ